MSTLSKRLLLISSSETGDPGLRATIDDAGYETTRWSCDAYASAALIVDHADLVIVDLDPADGGCFADLERRRSGTRGVPVLVVLAGTDAKERIDTLDAGADDCLSRPFDPQELRARLAALLRRNHEPKIRFGDFVWHWTHRQASIGSSPVLLSPCETLLLEELLKSPDRIVSTSTLTRRIDPSNSNGTLNRLYVYICRLRKKLASAQLEIRSASGLGYALDTRNIRLRRDDRVEVVVLAEAG